MAEWLKRLKRFWSRSDQEAALKAHLEELRRRTPTPVLWLFGKTQSGKTSIIKYLTGADDAEVGEGFRPCTRFSRSYQFPSAEAPLLSFLDTRGLDEPGYDPAEDLAAFSDSTHVVVGTVKALDHAQENVLKHLSVIRKARPSRPILLALTCLHEAYPQQQHPPYPFVNPEPELSAPVQGEPPIVVTPKPPHPDFGLASFRAGLEAHPSDDLRRSLDEQYRRFAELVDGVVPIDLTRPEEGYTEANYGGERLKEVLLEMLPGAYRQTLLTLQLATSELKDIHQRAALPFIVGYSALASAAGAIPIPFLDLLIIPGVQSKMVHDIARVYHQPLSARRFLELAASLGVGILARQGVREVAKLIPVVGPVAGAALAGTSTYALGKAFCYYLGAIHEGHVPSTDDLKRYYQDELARAEQAWGKK